MAHVVGHFFARGHVAAEGGKRFGERAHVDVDLILESIVAGRARLPSPRTPSPCASSTMTRALHWKQDSRSPVVAMSPAMENTPSVTIRHPADSGTFAASSQIFHVVVAEAGIFRRKGGSHHRGSRGFAIHDDVVVHADDGADDAEVGLEPGRERYDAGLAEKPGQLRFEFQVQRQRPVQEPGAGAAGAELLIGFDARLNDLGVCGESKIVVRTEHDAALALHDDLDVLLRFERMEIWINAKALGLGGRDGFAHFQTDRSLSVSFLCFNGLH